MVVKFTRPRPFYVVIFVSAMRVLMFVLHHKYSGVPALMRFHNVLTQVFNDLKIEASRSPEVSLFSRYKKHFELLPHKNIPSGELSRLSLRPPEHAEDDAEQLVQFMKQDVLNLLDKNLELQRGDYKEFVDLYKCFLNDDEDEFCDI